MYHGPNLTGRAELNWMNCVTRRSLKLVFALVLFALAGCATTPPKQQSNLCAVFKQYPDWYDYARASQQKWGIPIQIQMAFVRHESSYREDARPPFEWFLFIPLGRPSSARGYAQVQDPAWQDYKRQRKTTATDVCCKGDLRREPCCSDSPD